MNNVTCYIPICSNYKLNTEYLKEEYPIYEKSNYIVCKNPEECKKIQNIKYLDFYTNNTIKDMYNQITFYSGFYYLLKNIDSICDTDFFVYNRNGWLLNCAYFTEFKYNTIYGCLWNISDDSILKHHTSHQSIMNDMELYFEFCDEDFKNYCLHSNMMLMPLYMLNKNISSYILECMEEVIDTIKKFQNKYKDKTNSTLFTNLFQIHLDYKILKLTLSKFRLENIFNAERLQDELYYEI